MNLHLATYPSGDSLRALWLTDHPGISDEVASELTGADLPRSRKLELGFRRIVIGVCFDPLFVVAVGERAFIWQDTVSTLYLPLEEIIETDIPAHAMRDLIGLKDRFRVRTIFCPHEPAASVEALQRLEGLTHYPAPRVESAAKTRWPSFVDFELTAGIRAVNLPDERTISNQLNEVMSAFAIDPRTDEPMIGADSLPIPRLMFLDDFQVYRTLQSVRTNAIGGVTALWLAVQGMERTAVRRPTREERELQRERLLGGHRNPTGY